MRNQYQRILFAPFAFLRFTMCFVIVCAATLASSAQYFTIDTLKGDSPYNQDFSFIFPYLKSADKQAIADDINREMMKQVLNMELGQQQRSVFENIWGKKELDVAAVSNIAFKVSNNDADFVSLSIAATYCSGTCVDSVNYYNYDSHTGKSFSMSDLMTGSKLDMLRDSLKAAQQRRIHVYTDSLQYAINKKPLSDDDKRDYKRAIDAYTQCANSINPNLSFSLSKSKLTIHATQCLPFELHFLDKVSGDYVFEINYLKDYLTDYGKAILQP